MFNLKKLKSLNGKVVLSCSKVKGEKFEPVATELSKDTRWFKMTDNEVAQDDSTRENYEQVVGIVREFFGEEVKRAGITKILREKESKFLSLHLQGF